MCTGNGSEQGNWTGSYQSSVNSSESRNCSETESSSGPSSSIITTTAILPYYVPEWDAIHTNVRWIFLLHNYGFACLFFFLAFYAFFSILNLRAQISTRPYMSTINGFLCLLGLSRATELFIDPYGLMKIMPAFMGTLLWDLGFPCLVSSFSLIQIAFLQLTQVEIGPEKLRKKACLSITVTMHFVTVIASAICSSIDANLILMKLVTQLLFTLWGLVLCGSFLYAGKRVMGLLGNPGGSTSTDASSVGSSSSKGLIGMGMGLLQPGQNIAASLTAALAPTLLQSNAPKIKITDENDRTVSVASDSSRLNDNADATGNSGGRPLTPIPSASSSSSSKVVIIATTTAATTNGNGSPTGEPTSSTISGRPPSPVLPRRKSAGQALRTTSCPPGGDRGATQTVTLSASGRRISLNRRGSGYVDEKEAHRKKSLTWSESDVNSKGNRKGSSGEKIVEKTLLTAAGSSNGGDRKRRQSRKSVDNTVETVPERNDSTVGAESLLGGPDYTLQSILSHIAYVNQTALDYRLSRKLSRKCQVQRVLKFTSITAILGVLLCVAEMIRIISPYGLIITSSRPGIWPWFVLQTISRSIEFAMGATIANITKQPVNRPHHYAYSMRHKAHRESLYL